MPITRAYRHKVSFTDEQHVLACQFAGCARLIYNSGLEQRQLGYRATGKGMSYKRQTYFLKEAKAAEGFEFLKAAPAHVLQQALLDLQRAFTAFFERRAGYPQFKKRGDGDGFRFPDPDPKQIGVHDPARVGQVRLPKLGWVSIINTYPRLNGRLFEGELRYVSVVRDAGQWFISFTSEVPLSDMFQIERHYIEEKGATVGLDAGVANSVTTSNGEFHHLPVITDREWEKIGILQTRVNRACKGSRNREKAKRKLSKYRRGLRCRKLDQIHKLTTRFASENSIVCIEDLRVKNMTASAKGTVEQPGHNVAQKAGLNRAILDQCWGEIRRQLTYKCSWYGAILVIVPAKHTSQKCSACHHIAKDSRESQAVFHCVHCGHEQHADHNAACNILADGLARHARETAAAQAAQAGPADGLSARWSGKPGQNACEDASALKNPERPRPSRNTPPRGGHPKPHARREDTRGTETSAFRPR